MAGRHHGFSLFEILAVMSIVALTMVVAAPPVANMLDKVSFRKEINGVMSQVRGWKLLAVSKGKPVTVSIEEDTLVVQLGQEEEKRIILEQGVSLTMDPDHIRFSPEGWATPATILIRIDERQRRVWLDPLTGQPRKI